MEMKIEWSDFSEMQLKQVFDYYSKQASPRIARKLIRSITDRVSILRTNPLAGPKEELLMEYSQEFRYLVEGNYKIIYWISQDKITISSVFDCRQDPGKIKSL
jgi:plasmid stabilization system protein ParE